MELTCGKCGHKWDVFSGFLARQYETRSKCPKCKGQGSVSKAGLRSLIARDYTTRLAGRLARSDKTPEAKDKAMKRHYENQKEKIDAKLKKLTSKP